MVVSNTTVLLYMFKLNRIDLLQHCFKTIYIPEEVYQEILAGKEEFRYEVELLEKQIQLGYIIVEQVRVRKNFRLDVGENAALSLCCELNELVFLSDDKDARDAATMLNLEPMGTLGVLLWTLREKVITPQEFTRLLEQLMSTGYYISTQMYGEILKRVGQGKK